jgi:hypothetical protein
MIHLSKSQLQELTNIYLLANTPKSLLRVLLKTTAVDKLRRDCSPGELLEYYNRITTKAKRSPAVSAMAYAALIALLVKSPPVSQYPDSSFLQWGTIIESYLSQQFGTTSTLIITPDSPKPAVRLITANGAPIRSFGTAPNKPSTQLLQ